MAEIADAFAQWMRDYVTDGVPASGVNPPDKAEGRAIGPIIEAWIADQIAAALATLTPPGPSGPYVMPAYSTVSGWTGPSPGTAGFTMPTVIADDVALLQVIVDGGSGVIRPSGWTQIGTEIASGADAFALYWKRCDGTESGTTTGVTTTGGGNKGGVISTWRGCVANGDPTEAVDTNHGDYGGNIGTAMDGRAVTTLGPERLVVSLFSFTAGGMSGVSFGSADVGFTNVFALHAGGLAETAAAGDVQAAVAASTIAAPSRTIGANTIDTWACFSFALVPGT